MIVKIFPLFTQNCCSLFPLGLDLHLQSLMYRHREVDVTNLIPQADYTPGLAGQVDPNINKTKYFRLRLSDKVCNAGML